MVLGERDAPGAADASSVLELRINVGGSALAVRHHRAANPGPDAARGVPCVVMAHGLGGTYDTGVQPFAERFAAAGFDVLAFDYRHFGASAGTPRQLVSPRRQLEDYRAVVALARRTAGIDPERITLWGVSFSGGHVFRLAAEDPGIAAVVAMTPAPDGLAAVMAIARREGPLHGARLFARGLRDLVAARLGRPPVTAPLAGEPGTLAALTAPGAAQAYLGMAGPSWRNEVPARLFVGVGAYRPIRSAGAVRCPVLVQIAVGDRSAPPSAARAAAERSNAEVRHLLGDHFDVYAGGSAHELAVEGQLAFLRRTLGGVGAD